MFFWKKGQFIIKGLKVDNREFIANVSNTTLGTDFTHLQSLGHHFSTRKLTTEAPETVSLLCVMHILRDHHPNIFELTTYIIREIKTHTSVLK